MNLAISHPSANESFFAKPRARNAPIKSSFQSLPDLPSKLKIYRIAGSRYWQVRVYSLGKYTSKSLKTTDLEEAKAQARMFFDELSGNGGIVVKRNFKQALSPQDNLDLLHNLTQDILTSEMQKAERDEIKHGSYLMTKNRLEHYVFDFFKSVPLNTITSETLENFVDFLKSKKLSNTTIQGYLAQVRKLLRLLNRRNILPTQPMFPKVETQVNSRGAFTITEYRAILQKAKDLREKTFTDWEPGKKIWIKSDFHQMPTEMLWLIQFMVYTFVRPGDLRQIKHKHIEVIDGRFKYLRLNLPEIKRHKAATVSLPAAKAVYQRLHAYQCAQGYGGPDDYIFFPAEKNRRLLLDIIGWLFNWILNELDIKQGPHGIDRTLYSLRHTAITFRLIYGGNIDLLTLARNARTSVEMIEKFYASTLSAEMNIALLHSKRR